MMEEPGFYKPGFFYFKGRPRGLPAKRLNTEINIALLFHKSKQIKNLGLKKNTSM